MLMAVIGSSLIGAVLGIRFKVQVLFLAVPFAFVATAGLVGITQSALAPALLAGIAAVAALQIGYLGGLFTRFCLTAARATSKRSLGSTTIVQS